jgi:signal transduction histidine kinase
MVISFLFSLVIYSNIHNELERFRTFQERRFVRVRPLQIPADLDPAFNPQFVDESENRLKIMLLIINISILGLSGIAAYFLAGKTLKPIKKMMDDQNRFVTDASHELRTPLTSIRTEIEVNLRDKNLNLKDSKKLLQSNLEEVIHLQSLTDYLMELTPTGFNDNLMKIVSLKETMNKSINNISVLTVKKKIEIINEIQDIHVLGLQQNLIELFIILLDNAIKYSDSKTTITITSTTSRTYALIHITDQGMGMSQNDISHIFDRFYRSDKSRSKDNAKGYGLGLSIAQKIVHEHKGKIEVKSTLNKGSTFIIYLPLHHLT